MPEDYPVGIGGATSPIEKIIEVDVSSADYTPTTSSRAIFIDASAVAAVKFDTVESTGHVINNLAVGVWHPIRVKKVYHTGTTQTGIKLGY